VLLENNEKSLVIDKDCVCHFKTPAIKIGFLTEGPAVVFLSIAVTVLV